MLTKRGITILTLLLAITLTGLVTTANINPVHANPAVANLDMNSINNVDITQATTFTQTRTFRVGVVLDLVAGEVLTDVFAWQFVIRYDPAFVTAMPDPPTANDFFAAAGTGCWTDFTCSENAGTLVTFGRVAAADWGGRVLAGQASTVIKVDDPAFGAGTVLVAITTLAPATGFTISGVDTLFANVAFEIDAITPGPLTFRVTDVIVTNSAAVVIPVNAGVDRTVTISNSPPVAAGTVSTLTPGVGSAVTFDATGSTDDVSITNYIWDFGAGDVDGDGFTDSSCDTAAMTCTSPTASYAFQTAGTYRVTLRVRDNLLATGSARDQLGDPMVNDQPSHGSFAIIVGGTVNTPPTVNVPGPQTINELSPLSFTVTASDPDAGQTVTLSAIGVPPGATFNPTTGLFSWTPDESQGPGSTTVTFTATDDASSPLSDTETVMITVNEVNLAPVLGSIGGKIVDELSLLTFTATANDPDLPSQTLTFSLGAGAPSGAAITSLGVFTWSPTEAQGPGSYPIIILVSDGSLMDSEIITVDVLEVNTAPVLDPVGDKSADEGVAFTLTATATDTDLPTQSLAFSLGPGAPTGASISAGGVFTWTPSEEQGPGTYSITIIVSDGSLTDSETITITVGEVNLPPVISVPGPLSVPVGDTLSFTVTATDPDLPANTITLSATGLVAGMNLDPATGQFTFTPTDPQAGQTFTVTFTATDNGTPSLFNTGTVLITVGDLANRPPVLTVPGDQTVNEEAPLSFTVTATDPDAGQTVTLSATGIPGGANFDPATGIFSWTPTEDQGPGDYSVVFTATDNGTPSMFDTKTVVIHVNEVNLEPALNVQDAYSVQEGTLLTFTITATDPDRPPNTIVLSESGLPAGATFNPSTGEFSWTLSEADGPGDFTVTFTATDNGSPPLSDTKTVTIHVDEFSTQPVLTVPGPQTIDEESLLTFTITATDADLPAQTLILSATSLPPGASFDPATGTFTWTPAEDQGPGLFQATFQVSDGTLADIDSVVITVNEVNNPPVLDPVGDKSVLGETLLTFTVTASDADIPAQTLVFSLGSAPAGNFPDGASVDPATGVFSWTPTAAQTPGLYNVRILVSDGSAVDSEDIAITVTATPNNTPVLDPVGDKAIDEGNLLQFTITAMDLDAADLLTLTATGAPPGSTFTSTPSTGTVTGTFTWTPDESQGPGVFTITFTVSDGISSDLEQITITFNEVNTPPTLGPVGDKTVDEETLLTFTATASDPDIPANTLTFACDGCSAIGANINPSTGEFSWMPTEAQGPGSHQVTIRVSDGSLTDEETISTTVNEVNKAPQLTVPGPQNIAAGNTLTFTVTATDPDLPPNAIVLSATGIPTGASFNPSTGAFEFTPDHTQEGQVFTVTFTATDDGTPALSDTKTVDITVPSPENQPPVLDPVGDKIVDEQTLLIFLATGSDPDEGDTLTFSLSGAPAGAIIDTAGQFQWTPTEAQGPGTLTVTIIVSDGFLTDYETITIDVNEVNAAPVLAAVGDKSVDEETLLTFTGSATDADQPANTLTFTLGPGAPSGATIAASGVFGWMPTEAQGPGNYSVTIIVTDNGTPELSDSETITIAVSEVNKPPTLTVPSSPQTVIVGFNLTFTVSATDPDQSSNAITLSATGLEAGMSFSPSTGQFSFAPASGQAGMTFTLGFTATDDGEPSMSDSDTVTVIVQQIQPPGERILLTFDGCDMDSFENGIGELSVFINGHFVVNIPAGLHNLTGTGKYAPYNDVCVGFGPFDITSNIQQGANTLIFQNPLNSYFSQIKNVRVMEDGTVLLFDPRIRSNSPGPPEVLTFSVPPLVLTSFGFVQPAAFATEQVTLQATFTGGTAPFRCTFSFGDGDSKTVTTNTGTCSATHTYWSARLGTAVVRVRGSTLADDVRGQILFNVEPQPGYSGAGLQWRAVINSDEQQTFTTRLTNPASITVLIRLDLTITRPGSSKELFISPSFMLSPGQTLKGLTFNYLPSAGLGTYCFKAPLKYGVDANGNGVLEDSEVLGKRTARSGCFYVVDGATLAISPFLLFGAALFPKGRSKLARYLDSKKHE